MVLLLTRTFCVSQVPSSSPSQGQVFSSYKQVSVTLVFVSLRSPVRSHPQQRFFQRSVYTCTVVFVCLFPVQPGSLGGLCVQLQERKAVWKSPATKKPKHPSLYFFGKEYRLGVLDSLVMLVQLCRLETMCVLEWLCELGPWFAMIQFQPCVPTPINPAWVVHCACEAQLLFFSS